MEDVLIASYWLYVLMKEGVKKVIYMMNKMWHVGLL